jgi:hypothetical protein
MRTTALLLSAPAVAVALLAPSPAAASAAHCKPVLDPYPHTRYAKVDLSRIRAVHTSCATARHVARRAHRKALRMGAGSGPIRRFTWHGWRVTGDLRPDSDRYVARKGERRVRWRF